ncbi:MAG: CBS domain-containing protein [Gemmataceae bacterium]
MTREVVTVPAGLPVRELLRQYFLHPERGDHQAYPVVDGDGRLLGVITRANLLHDWIAAALPGPDWKDDSSPAPVLAFDLIHREPITAYAWESCRTAAERMAEHGVGRLPVVADDDPRRLVGLVSRSDLLKSRARHAEEEAVRERFLAPRFRRDGRPPVAATPAPAGPPSGPPHGN